VKIQLNELAYGSDIIVATPGRLNDLVDRGVVSLSQVNFLVLDEADRMLDMGFEVSFFHKFLIQCTLYAILSFIYTGHCVLT